MAKQVQGEGPKKVKRGRPSKFTEVDLKQVETLARKGWTDLEMSEFFCVSYATWNNWKGSQPDFLDSLKGWKAEADERVERSLYERAVGYSHPEDKILQNNGIPVIVPTIKHYPPDTTAMIYWLKNRQPDRWRDSQNIELTGKDGGALIISTNVKFEKPDADG